MTGWRRPRILATVAFALLMILNVSSVTTSEWFSLPPKPYGDGADYENLAFHLVQGKGFLFDNTNVQWRAPYEADPARNAQLLDAAPRQFLATGRPPLYPLVISGIYRICGRGPGGFAMVRLFSATCLALAGAVSVLIVARLLSAERPWMASLGVAVTLAFIGSNRTLRDYCSDFLTEPMALCLMQLFVVSLLVITGCFVSSPPSDAETSRLLTRRGVGRCMAAGVLFGALILTRSMFVLWLPAIVFLLWMSLPYKQTQCIALIAVFTITCLCMCAPWWLRNVAVLGVFMPLGTQGPIALVGGYSDEALAGDGDWQYESELQLRRRVAQSEGFRTARDETQRELLVALAAKQEFSHWIRNHVSDLPRLAIKRIYVHWNPYTGRSLIWRMAILAGAMWLVFRRDRAAWWLIGLPLTSTLVVAVLYSTGGRFLVPLYGILFVLSGLGVAGLGASWLPFSARR